MGNSSSASVTVRDDDLPLLPPIGLRANGNIVNGEVSIWWDASIGATAYDLRYTMETCTHSQQGDASTCTPGTWTEDDGIAGTSTKLSIGTDSSDKLAPSVVYRLQVRSTNADTHSDWSALAFIYPTSSPPEASLISTLFSRFSVPPLVATAPLYGHHEYQGNPVFRFAICDGTIPSGVDKDADDIEAAIEKWEEAVKKESGGDSLIETRRYESSGPGSPPDCKPPVAIFPSGDNAVIFADDDDIRWALCFGDGTPACWRSNTWDQVLVLAGGGNVVRLPSIAEGTILLRKTRTKGGSASDWNALVDDGSCTYLEHTLVHEAGHALGIGWPPNDHPRNPDLSIMSAGYTHTTGYCEPQAYDIVAMMANYQSR